MRAYPNFNIFTALSQTAGTSFLTKAVSITLAVLFFISPLGNTASASVLINSGDEGYVTTGQSQGGNQLSQFDVNEATGGFNHIYDISLPAGVNGHTPQLTLQYNNQSASDQNILGYGWSLSIPYIERINKEGVDKMFDSASEVFSSNLSGELVQDGSNYRAKVTGGDFMTYSRSGDEWIAVMNDGTEYRFGSDTNARQSDENDNTKISRWHLSTTTDANGNVITYQYNQDTGVVYPSSITYGPYTVTFTTEAASAQTAYNLGFRSERDQRISKIEIAENSTIFKRYDLAYETGINGQRDLLASITETDTLATDSLPPVTFDYSGQTLPTWQDDNTVDFPEPLTHRDNGVRFGDLNGDGLTDIIRYYELYESGDPSRQYTIRRVHINEGNGNWDIDASWDWDDIQVPFHYDSENVVGGINNHYQDMGVRLTDVNGDGKDDLVVAYDCVFYPLGTYHCGHYDNDYDSRLPKPQMGVYINTGSGFALDTSWTGFKAITGWHMGPEEFFNPARELIDVNGDGLADQVESFDDDGYIYKKTKMNTGSGWTGASSSWDLPIEFPYGENNWREFGVRFADVNGDGLTDILRGYRPRSSNPSQRAVYINTGNGWATTTDWQLPVDFLIDAGVPEITEGYHLLDVNGDQLPDIIQSYVNHQNTPHYEYHINTGNGWTQQSYTLPFLLNTGYRAYSAGQAMIDFDGDAMIDAWDLYYPDLKQTQSSDGQVRLNTSDKPDLLTTVTSKEGGTISVTYDGFRSSIQSDLNKIGNGPVNPVVVTEVTTDDSFGNQFTETYDYESASYYSTTTDIHDRRFAGFGKVTKTTDLGKEITYYHQGNGDDTATGETGDSEARIGMAYRTEVTDLSDNLYQLTHTKYTDHDLGNGATYVAPVSTLTQQYDGDGDRKDRAASYTYDTSHGSLLTQVEHGEVSGNADGTFSDIGTDSRTTTYTYATNATTGVVAPHTVTFTDHSSTKINETKLSYDNLAHGSVDIGNVTTEETLVDGTNYVDRTYTYDSYGNVLAETDPENNTTTYTYNSFNLYPATVTNDLSQVTAYEYDYRSGQVSKVTDPNGNITRNEYDGFGRLTEEHISDPQTGTEVLKTTILYSDVPGFIDAFRTDRLDNNNIVISIQHIDGFGRPYQTRTESETGYIVTDTIYGADGTIESESLPYESTGLAPSPATTNTDLLTTYTYDPLKRVTAVTNALGTTNTDYDQWEETVTDPENNEKTYSYDAFGRLAQVDEENGASTYTTSYEWRADDVLTKITDADGNERNLTYDGRGLRTSLEDLHDPADSSFGTWTFGYDDAGNLTSQTDPNGDTTSYTYDDLNRVLTEDSDSTSGTDITYSYDTCTEGIGFLCSATTPDVTTDYAYTYTGAIASEDRTIDGTTYTTSYEYDRQGNQTKIVYPDGSDVIYAYNDRGLIEDIQQRESSQSYNTIISNFDYAPHGLASTIDHANGAVTTRTFDATKLYRLESLVTDTPGTGGPGAEHAAIEAELSGFTVAEDAVAEKKDKEKAKTKPNKEPIVEAASSSEPVEELEPVVAGTATTTEAEEVVDEKAIEVVEETTGTSTDEVIEEEAKEEIVFAIDPATTTASTTPAAPVVDIVPTEETHTNSTPAVAEEEKVKKPEKPKFIGKSKIKVPTDTPHEARLWQKFHRERLAGLQAAGIAVDQKTINAAKYAKEEFDKHLVEKKYIDAPDQTVKTSAQEYLKRKGKKFLESVIDTLLPAEAQAYLFGTENFESCSSLPCSFDNDVSWGSVTPSVDTGSQVEGSNSLKEVATGSGGGGLEFADQNRDEVYVQFKFFMPSNMAWGPSGYYNILEFDDSSDGTMFWLTVEDWGTARLTMMGDALPWTDTGINLQKGAVNTIELRFKKGASNGEIDIWVNNTNESSPDYSGSSLNTGTDNVDDIMAGLTYTPEAISTTYYDDVVVDTAFIGELSGGGPGPGAGTVQDLTYAYDAVGNITSITDAGTLSGTNVTNYTYDDLYRLTNASNANYNRTYTYDALGNITSKSDVGSYAYDGNQGGGGTSYALYDDAVATGWVDWSWTINIDPSDTSPVHEGTYSIEAAYTSVWGGIAYHHNNFDTTPYDDLELAVNIGNNTSIELYLYFTDASHNVLTVQNLENYVSGGWSSNTWHEITVPLSDLGIDNYTGGTTFHIESSQAVTVNYDDIKFTGGGGGGANYANPHAATTIGNVTHDYDANGNLISTSDGLVNTWNYRNELTQSVEGGVTVTYGYDHTGQRVKKTEGSNTTYYPFGHYEVKNGDVIKHIYANDMLVATIDDGTVTHVHVDHLGSSNVMSDSVGGVAQLLTYYPFGGTETDTQYGGTDQTKRFGNYDFDEETGLNYAGARYQSGTEGRFTSQDPVAHEIGHWEGMNEDAAIPLPEYFRDPQRFNTYAYAGNNPIKNVDKNGKDYYEVGGDATVFGYGVTLSAKYDPAQGRLDIGGGAGLSAGLGGSFTGGYNFGDLPEAHTYASQELTGFACIFALCAKGSVANTVDEPLSNDIDLSVDGGIYGGVGLGGAIQPSGSLNVTVFDRSQNYNMLKNIVNSLQKIVDNLRETVDQSNNDEDD